LGYNRLRDSSNSTKLTEFQSFWRQESTDRPTDRSTSVLKDY